MYAQAATKFATNGNSTRFRDFDALGPQAAGHLMAISALQRKSPGEALFAEGDESGSVYKVVSGMVRLYKLLPDGRRLVTGFLSEGHLLGIAPEGHYVYTAEAVTDITVCRYKRSAFERLIDDVPGFAKCLLTVTSHELRAAQDRMLLLGRKSAVEKVASFILLMGERSDSDDAVDLPMTREDIADYLGLTIETVSRTFSKLRQDGIIALPTSAHIEIRDHDKLEELAAGDDDSVH